MSIDSVDVWTLTTALFSVPTLPGRAHKVRPSPLQEISAHYTEILNY
jgi:hypothetical protein